MDPKERPRLHARDHFPGGPDPLDWILDLIPSGAGVPYWVGPTSYLTIYEDPDCIGLWRFNEATGTTFADTSTDGTDGDVTGGTVTATLGVPGPPLLTAHLSDSLAIRDQTVVMTPAQYYATAITTGEFSFTCWAKTDAANQSSVGFPFQNALIVRTDQSGVHGATVHGIGLDGLRLIGWCENSSVYGPTLTADVWYHLACTYDGAGTFTVYLNGISVATITGLSSVANIPRNGAQFFHNKNISYDAYYKGDACDLSIWKRALTQPEVQAIAAGQPIDPSALGSWQIATGLIDSTYLAANAVTTAAVADGAITRAKLATDAQVNFTVDGV